MAIGKALGIFATIAVTIVAIATLIGSGLAYQTVFENNDNTEDVSYMMVDTVGNATFHTEYGINTSQTDGESIITCRILESTTDNADGSKVDFAVSGVGISDKTAIELVVSITSDVDDSCGYVITFYGEKSGNEWSDSDVICYGKGWYDYDDCTYKFDICKNGGDVLTWGDLYDVNNEASIVKYITIASTGTGDWKEVDGVPSDVSNISISYKINSLGYEKSD